MKTLALDIDDHQLGALHDHFLALLPRIQQHGRVYFRHLDPHKKADAIQEMRALAWKWLLRLHQRRKDPSQFIGAFTKLLTRAVSSGRRVTGMAKAKDVMNPSTQRRHGFKVEPLPSSSNTSHPGPSGLPHNQALRDAYEERLRDNTITPIPDQVQFRIDFPAWLDTLTGREKRIVREMANNERTLDISHRFELSPSRISQMRHELHEEWRWFCGEREETTAGT